jgi:hypothetical protein
MCAKDHGVRDQVASLRDGFSGNSDSGSALRICFCGPLIGSSAAQALSFPIIKSRNGRNLQASCQPTEMRGRICCRLMNLSHLGRETVSKHWDTQRAPMGLKYDFT